MNKLFFFITILITSLCSAQTVLIPSIPFPVRQNIGAPKVLSNTMGATQSTVGIILGNYTDTTEANTNPYIKHYAGAMIRTEGDILWERDKDAKKWLRDLGSPNSTTSVTNMSVLNDSTILVCTGTNVCDTLHINNLTITNVSPNTSYISSDTTIVLCDTLGHCDTFNIPKQQLYIFQNALTSPSRGIIEFGGNLLHNTNVHTWGYHLSLTGYTVYDYPLQVERNTDWQSGSGAASFKLGGSTPALSNTYTPNLVRLGIDFVTDNYQNSPLIPNYFNGASGYFIGVNGTGNGSYGLRVDDITSKVGGIFFHTNDTTTKDAITIYGMPRPNQTYVGGTLGADATLAGKRIATFKNDKQVRFFGYASSGFRVNDTTSYKPVTVDVNGDLWQSNWPVGGGTTTVTADNGLTANTSTNVQLGGTLLKTTSIYNDTYDLTIFGSPASNNLKLWNLGTTDALTAVAGSGYGVNASSNTIAINATGTNYGVVATATNTAAVDGMCNNCDFAAIFGQGQAGKAGLFTVDNGSSTGILTSTEIRRQYSSYTPSNGFGVALDFGLTSNGSPANYISNSIHSYWTTSTEASRTSNLAITGVNSASTNTLATFKGSGQGQLNMYGIGTFAGTAIYGLGVDGSGNIIETTATGGGTSSGTVTSVGLTMPAAFNVANSPVTSAGTLAVTGAGTVTQTIAGNGSLVNNKGLTALSYSSNILTATLVSGETVTTTINTSSSNTFAGNGLSKVSDSIYLGGTLIHTTTVNNAGFETVWTGAYSGGSQSFQILNSSGGTTLGVNNNGSSPTASIQNAGNGEVLLITSSGGNLALDATTVGTSGAAQFTVNPSATNTILPIIEVRRYTSGTAAAGIGGSIRYTTKMSSSTATSNELISKWTNATNGAQTSQFIVRGVNSTTLQDIFYNYGNGDAELPITSSGLILKSPDGTRYKITVPNGGASLTITAL